MHAEQSSLLKLKRMSGLPKILPLAVLKTLAQSSL